MNLFLEVNFFEGIETIFRLCIIFLGSGFLLKLMNDI